MVIYDFGNAIKMSQLEKRKNTNVSGKRLNGTVACTTTAFNEQEELNRDVH